MKSRAATTWVIDRSCVSSRLTLIRYDVTPLYIAARSRFQPQTRPLTRRRSVVILIWRTTVLAQPKWLWWRLCLTNGVFEKTTVSYQYCVSTSKRTLGQVSYFSWRLVSSRPFPFSFLLSFFCNFNLLTIDFILFDSCFIHSCI